MSRDPWLWPVASASLRESQYQSSRSRPGTRRNSFVLWVTSRANGRDRCRAGVPRTGLLPHLPSVHELPPLPPDGAPGTWREPAFFGLGLTAAADGPCLVISGEGGRLRLRYAVCEGALRSLEMEATYGTPVNRQVQGRLRLERLERRRGEEPARWLDNEATRDAVVSGWLVAHSPLLPVADLGARRGGGARLDGRLEIASRRFDPYAAPPDGPDAALATVVRAVFGGSARSRWRSTAGGASKGRWCRTALASSTPGA